MTHSILVCHVSIRSEKSANTPYFQEKTVLIFGAACQLGRAIAYRAVRLGARVVLVDDDACQLSEIAQYQPDRIESLCLNDLSDLGKLIFHWQDASIDVLIDIIEPTRSSSKNVVARSKMLLNGLCHSLDEANGTAITVLLPAPSGSLTDVAKTSGLARLHLERNNADQCGRFHLLELTDANIAPEQEASICDLLFTLSHPQSHALWPLILHKIGV